ALVNSYLRKHAEIHRDMGVSDDFLTNQIAIDREKLTQVEDQLRAAKLAAGVTELADAKRTISERVTSLRADILNANADLAQHEATLKEMARLSSSATSEPGSTNAPMEAIPSSVSREYKNI